MALIHKKSETVRLTHPSGSIITQDYPVVSGKFFDFHVATTTSAQSLKTLIQTAYPDEFAAANDHYIALLLEPADAAVSYFWGDDTIVSSTVAANRIGTEIGGLTEIVLEAEDGLNGIYIVSSSASYIVGKVFFSQRGA